MDEDASLEDAFKRADDVLHNAVAGIAEIINVPGLVNVDFADVRTVMGEQGKAMMGIGEAAGVDRARLAAEQAVASPLLDGVDLSGARGVIVNITATRALKLRETNDVINTIKAFCAEDATIIHGTVFEESMTDRLRVTVVATGIGRRSPAARPVLVAPVARTGTDDGAPARSQPNYGELEAPAVWRSPRASAAAQVQALEESGVERYDIPAFLRKQAD
jgi:cell division protein FtsZ